ncbi:hypothetical protein M9Y10_017827 [Tritrichomonas musculus]|uniref:Uncharacterized protein n=1 Tax=Tritrichomonas musculus TaxID=1915356 RepID=A0ABR2HVM8_9EUKA
MRNKKSSCIITNIFQISSFIFALLIGCMIIGHFIAHFSVGKIRSFKYAILILSLFIGIISFLFLYTEILPIIILVTLLTLFRWVKYVFHSYPFIDSVESLVDFGISLFLTVCSILLWLIFEIPNFEHVTLLKFGEFFFSTILIPLLIIFTICFNDKKNKTDENDEKKDDDPRTAIDGTLQNCYIDFSNKLINRYAENRTKKTKKE